MKLVRSLFFWGWTPVMCLAVLAGSVACGPGAPPEPPSDVKTDNANVNIDGQIVLTWTLAQGLQKKVAKFRVYRSDRTDGDFKNNLVKTITQAEGTLDKAKKLYAYKYRDTNVIVGGKYEVPFFYRISAVGPDGREGKMSAPLEARTKNQTEPDYVADIKVSGSNIFNDILGKAEPRIIISWKANREYDIDGYYVFRIDKDESIPTTNPAQAINKEGLIPHKPGKTISWANNLKEDEIGKPYWYTVIAVDKGNTLGRSRPSERFRGLTLNTATLVSPANGTTAAKPVFKWKEVDSANGYVVVVQASPRGDVKWRSKFIPKGTTEATLPSSVDLTPSVNYYWFVSAYAENPKSKEDKGNSTSKLWVFTAASDD